MSDLIVKNLNFGQAAQSQVFRGINTRSCNRLRIAWLSERLTIIFTELSFLQLLHKTHFVAY